MIGEERDWGGDWGGERLGRRELGEERGREVGRRAGERGRGGEERQHMTTTVPCICRGVSIIYILGRLGRRLGRGEIGEERDWGGERERGGEEGGGEESRRERERWGRETSHDYHSAM